MGKDIKVDQAPVLFGFREDDRANPSHSLEEVPEEVPIPQGPA